MTTESQCVPLEVNSPRCAVVMQTDAQPNLSL